MEMSFVCEKHSDVRMGQEVRHLGGKAMLAGYSLSRISGPSDALCGKQAYLALCIELIHVVSIPAQAKREP